MEQTINQDVAVGMTNGVAGKKNTGLIVGMIACAVLAAGGIGFGVYGMMKASGESSKISDLKVQVEDKDGKVTTLETDEIKVSNDSKTITISDSGGAYADRDLKSKTLRLFGAKDGVFEMGYGDDTNSFMIASSYMPATELITNSLDESSKTYITLETTSLDKDKYCSYQFTDGVKADIDAALGQQASNITFGNGNFDCISYDKANDDHYDLWGESIPKINGISDALANGDFAYGSNLDTYYYHIIGGRGGTCTSFVVGRIAQIDKKQDSANVDIDAGVFDICAGKDGELYSDIERGGLYKTIGQNDVNWDGLELTEDDYGALQSYRFVFKKNSNGIYSFSKVEKL